MCLKQQEKSNLMEIFVKVVWNILHTIRVGKKKWSLFQLKNRKRIKKGYENFENLENNLEVWNQM